ncbi:MAG: radical SAM protein [bacterium]
MSDPSDSMGKISIGFIHATNRVDVHWFKPLSFGYLKAYLQKHLDAPFDMEFIEGDIEPGRYDIIAVSSTSQDYARAMEIAREAKKAENAPVTVIGGHHVTYMPETLSEDYDVAVLGEGEQTFLELIKHAAGNGLSRRDGRLSAIDGLAVRADGGVKPTRPRSLITPLDALPHPCRHAGDVQYLFTSRGCPYKCAFCSSSAFWMKTRTFSAEYVADEIGRIVEEFPETNHIPVEDDLFVVSRTRLERIVELLEEKKLNGKVRFSVSVRADLVNDELCRLLKRLNVHEVCFGAESASDRILSLLKKRITLKDNRNALETLHRHGIPAVCSFIIGVPSETEEETRATYEFVYRNVLRNRMTLGSAVNVLMPMPGTEMWAYAVERGAVDPANMDWNRLAVFASYRSSGAKDFSGWADIRRRNGSIYLNEETLPQERLYAVMAEYEGKLAALERRRARRRKRIPFKLKRFLKRLAVKKMSGGGGAG